MYFFKILHLIFINTIVLFFTFVYHNYSGTGVSPLKVNDLCLHTCCDSFTMLWINNDQLFDRTKIHIFVRMHCTIILTTCLLSMWPKWKVTIIKLSVDLYVVCPFCVSNYVNKSTQGAHSKPHFIKGKNGVCRITY